MLFLRLRGKHIDLYFDLCDCPRIFFTHFRESKTNCLISHLSVMGEQCMNIRLEAHSLINQICPLGFVIDRMNSSASLYRIACCVIIIHVPLHFQDEENIVPSWELRVEGRVLEEVMSEYMF